MKLHSENVIPCDRTRKGKRITGCAGNNVRFGDFNIVAVNKVKTASVLYSVPHRMSSLLKDLIPAHVRIFQFAPGLVVHALGRKP